MKSRKTARTPDKWHISRARARGPRRSCPALCGEGYLEEDQVDLDADTEIDGLKLSADDAKPFGGCDAKFDGVFANVFHDLSPFQKLRFGDMSGKLICQGARSAP